jgi:hypothetical protein
VVVVLLMVALTVPKPLAYAKTGDWSTYLGNNARSGFNGAETIQGCGMLRACSAGFRPFLVEGRDPSRDSPLIGDTIRAKGGRSCPRSFLVS